MTIAQLQEKRNKAISDAQTLMAGETITAEQRTQFDALMTDVASTDSDIARITAVEEQRSAVRNLPANQRPNPSESNDPEERAEVRNARVKASLRSYMLTGKVESRDLTAAGQGVAIPQLFDSQIIEAQKSYGDIYSLVDVIKTDSGNPMKVVLTDDTANGLVPLSVGVAAGEADPTISGKTLQVDVFTTGTVRLGLDLLQDSGFDMESWIRDQFGKRFYRGASGLILNGDGGAVESLLTDYAGKGITTASTGKLGYADFVAAQTSLDPAYQPNAVWAMSNATLGAVLSITDSNQRPLFLAGYGDGTQGFVGSILGRPVKLIPQLASVASGNTVALYGDFKSAYRFRQQNPGVAILRQNELYSAGYEVGFVGFARCGGISLQVGPNTPLIPIAVK